MSYANLHPGMWDDRDFYSLSLTARLVWLYLLTGPEAAQGFPGLLQLSPAGISDALRLDGASVSLAVNELVERKLVELDVEHRIIRVPAAPKHKRPGNANVLKGWYRRWRELTSCRFKYDHLVSFDAVIPTWGPKIQATWWVLFGPHIDPKAFESLRQSLSEGLEGQLNLSEGIKASESLSKATLSGSSIRNPRSGIRDPESGRRGPPPGTPAEPVFAEGTASGLEVLAPKADEGWVGAPFTVGEGLDVLARASLGRVTGRVTDPGTEVQVRDVFDVLAAHGVDLAALELAGAWLGAGGDAWQGSLGPRWVAKHGHLADVVDKAAQWDRQGRPSLDTRRVTRRANGAHRPAPAGLSDDEIAAKFDAELVAMNAQSKP